MRVLVTGGAGFIGSHLVDALQESGHEITILDDFSSGRELNIKAAQERALKQSQHFEVIQGNVSERKVWDGISRHDAVFHLAAQVSVTGSVNQPGRDFSTNVSAVDHMVQWIRGNQVRILLYGNTGGAIYGQPLSFPTDERHSINPISPYGATKAFAELYVSALSRSLKDSGEWSSRFDDGNYFTWASMRLGNVFGPRQVARGEAAVVPTFIDLVSQGKQPTIFGDGRKTRDYIFVSDVVSAFMVVFEKMKSMAVDDSFNVGTGIETFDIDVFDTVLDALHTRARAPGAPANLKRATQVNEPIFAAHRSGELLRSCLNVNKLEAYLGWRPKVDFNKGIVEIVNSYNF